MLPTAAFIAGAMLGAADLTAATPAPDPMPPLHLHGVPLARSVPDGPLRLQEPAWSRRSHEMRFFGGERLAQQAPAITPEPSPPPAATPTPDDAAAADGPTPEEIQEAALMRQRRGIRDIHRPLGVTTWAALAGTVFFGTIAAINQPTLFGGGLCENPNPDGSSRAIFGSYGCQELGIIHEASAFITVSLYTATGIYALNMLRLDNAAHVSGHDNTALAIHKILAYVHLAGMIIQPILGIITTNPDLVGVGFDPMNPTRQRDFAAAMRTVHVGVGYVTFAALTGAMILEYY